jgi:hypothetical protein
VHTDGKKKRDHLEKLADEVDVAEIHRDFEILADATATNGSGGRLYTTLRTRGRASRYYRSRSEKAMQANHLRKGTETANLPQPASSKIKTPQAE